MEQTTQAVLVSFNPPLMGQLKKNGAKIKITGYLPEHPPRFQIGGKAFVDSEEINVDTEQTFPELCGAQRKLSPSHKTIVRERLLEEQEKAESELSDHLQRKKTLSEGSESRLKTHLADNNTDLWSPLIDDREKNCRRRLKKIQMAFLRLEFDLYGICSICHEEIPMARLEKSPWTDKHVTCKEQRELEKHNNSNHRKIRRRR